MHFTIVINLLVSILGLHNMLNATSDTKGFVSLAIFMVGIGMAIAFLVIKRITKT